MGRPKNFDREDVIDRATDLFWLRGYESVSIQDLVDHLGLSRSSLYECFGDKQGLYLATLDRYRQTGHAWLREQLATDAPLRPTLARLFAAILDEIAADSGTHGCFVVNATAERGPTDPATATRNAEALQAMRALFTEALLRAQQRGDLGTERDAYALACLLTNTVYGLRVTARTRPERAPLEAVVAETLRALD